MSSFSYNCLENLIVPLEMFYIMTFLKNMLTLKWQEGMRREDCLVQPDRQCIWATTISLQLKFKREEIAEIYNSMCVSSGRNPQIVLTLS